MDEEILAYEPYLDKDILIRTLALKAAAESCTRGADSDRVLARATVYERYIREGR